MTSNAPGTETEPETEERGHVSENNTQPVRSRWNLGILHDKETNDVPGSVMLLADSKAERLGLDRTPQTRHRSSMPGLPLDPKKRTKDGRIILDPQPDDSDNDPLNWPTWRRDSALLSVGLYCMVGGGTTPLLAAGFTNVAQEYNVQVETVALTTGLYMAGLGLGAVILTPTAILFGKRPVYLGSAVAYVATSIWCAASPTFPSLVVARIIQGMSVSPVECLPSATIAEIFFLHERAFRIGIYTLLLLGGKNLVPLVSAAVIGALGWRWVFWVVAMVVAFCGCLLFLFVPETFWDRSPIPWSRRSSRRPSRGTSRGPSRRPSFIRRTSSAYAGVTSPTAETMPKILDRSDEASEKASNHELEIAPATTPMASPALGHHPRHGKELHVGFAPSVAFKDEPAGGREHEHEHEHEHGEPEPSPVSAGTGAGASARPWAWENARIPPSPAHGAAPAAPAASSAEESGKSEKSYFHDPSSPAGVQAPSATRNSPDDNTARDENQATSAAAPTIPEKQEAASSSPPLNLDEIDTSQLQAPPKQQQYTHTLRHKPARSFTEHLRIYNGRLSHDKWFKVMLRPFILFTYPAVLWSAALYACSVGWLIVISESMAMMFRDPDSYDFTALQAGLVYVSPFVGGILGTGVAGRLSDVIVQVMARRNGGLYEPEFRLVMVIPVVVSTCAGLMGFGWSVQQRDAWIVPTVFFGVISFGCSLGSTTAVTFCVDSYKQYAGEALVTLNLAKNILHGLVFSIFFTHWLADEGPRMVFIWLGVIQLVCCLTTVPMYVYGKRARMWTVRKNLVERL